MNKKSSNQKNKIKFKTTYHKSINYSWLVGITIGTLLLAILFGYISLIFMEKLNVIGASLILFLLIFIGVFFDILGIAVTAADEVPFHSMASNKVSGAKESIFLIRNAGIVANFCNDVIGDISGIISGTATGAIILKVNQIYSINSVLWSILLTAMVAGITVGGKALGKELALKKANEIIYQLGMILHIYSLLKKAIVKKSNENNI
ncbi:MAG: hypothetical protein GX347_06155 [Epulopiscium sp.]|nr:hypothetical protein [Candidatus Epulonipiscium sp.]